MRIRTLGLLLSLLVSCHPGPDKSAKVGHLEVQWTGSHQGRITGPATAEWCADRRLLEIRTVQGDTGIALALYPAKTLVSGRYRVVDPTQAESLPPAAGVALRWLTQSAVQGFQGDSGTIDLERSGSDQLSGQLRGRARSVVDTQKILLSGTFRDLTLRPQGRACAAPSERPGARAEPGDTGLH